MAPGDYGTKAVPTYIAAEAETTPLPKITVPEAPPPRSPRKRPGRGLGDLPMRVVYRALAVAGAVVALGAAGVVVLVVRDEPAPRTHTAAASAAPASAGAAAATATPGVSASPSASPSGGGSSGRSAALEAALADPRVPALPAGDLAWHKPRGRAAATRGLVRDRRSGVAFSRFAKGWRTVKAKPFASRQVLPRVKGSELRGMLVSCPVPIIPQENLRDTAFLAARWTLNHHPSGATITWTASQAIKAGKRDGWLLAYRVNYTLKGERHESMAAVALVDVPEAKPALVFVTIPDGQRKHWPDIAKVISSVKAL